VSSSTSTFMIVGSPWWAELLCKLFSFSCQAFWTYSRAVGAFITVLETLEGCSTHLPFSLIYPPCFRVTHERKTSVDSNLLENRSKMVSKYMLIANMASLARAIVFPGAIPTKANYALDMLLGTSPRPTTAPDAYTPHIEFKKRLAQVGEETCGWMSTSTVFLDLSIPVVGVQAD
jgi:hypothetical protein